MSVSSHSPLKRRPWNQIPCPRPEASVWTSMAQSSAVSGHRGSWQSDDWSRVIQRRSRLASGRRTSLQKIHHRRVGGVQTELNVPPLQPEERHRLVEGGHQPRQYHDLTARWSGIVEEEGTLRAETLQLVLGETQGALHRVPEHPQESEVGCGDKA
jgi:hypothetical protein